MIGIFYSFKDDQDALVLSVKAFRHAYPSGVVAVCDDGEKSCDEAVVDDLKCDYYERRDWDGKRNLNGWVCVREMMKLQIKLHELFPEHEGSVKIDCDTLVTSCDWHDSTRPASGLDMGTDSVMTGCCRYMRKDTPQVILDLIGTRWRWETFAVPEDKTIAVLLLQTYGKEIELIPWHSVAHSFDLTKSAEESKVAKIVGFGNRMNLKDIKGGAARRKHAAEKMHEYMKRVEIC